MSESKRIKTALVSVYHKEGLDEIITKLHEEGVEFLSTGGTRQLPFYSRWSGKDITSENIRRYSLSSRVGARSATD